MTNKIGGGNLVIDQYAEDGLRKTPTTVNTIQEIFNIIDTNMSNFNGRILDCEKELRVLHQAGGKKRKMKTRRVKKGKKTARKVQTRKYRKMTRKHKKHPRRARKTRSQRGGGFLSSVAPETSRMMGASVNSVTSLGHTLTGHPAPESNYPWVQDNMSKHLPEY